MLISVENRMANFSSVTDSDPFLSALFILLMDCSTETSVIYNQDRTRQICPTLGKDEQIPCSWRWPACSWWPSCVQGWRCCWSAPRRYRCCQENSKSSRCLSISHRAAMKQMILSALIKIGSYSQYGDLIENVLFTERTKTSNRWRTNCWTSTSV